MGMCKFIDYILLVSLVLATMIDNSVDTSNPLQNVSMLVLLLVYHNEQQANDWISRHCIERQINGCKL